MVSHVGEPYASQHALVGPEFNETQGEKLAVIFNPAKADNLFEGSGHSFDEILKLAKDRKQLPRFPLTASIEAKAKIEKKDLESANVVAKLPGSDPELKNEFVVLSAHIDHIGIGEPINGDRIYNGAMDNASGSALLLDVAASLKKSPDKLKRSLLFLFVTGEEKGLLGSKYFAAHPTVDSRSMVADINVDMFLPIVPLKVLTVFGLASPISAIWPVRLRKRMASVCNPTLSRSATSLFEAINTTSSGMEFQPWRWALESRQVLLNRRFLKTGLPSAITLLRTT